MVFPKLCITFASEIQKDNDLMATLLNVSSFETFFDMLDKIYNLRYNSLRFCCDNNGLREIRKKVYSRKTSNQKPWTLSQALDFTKRKLEGDRPLGNSIVALLGSLFCIVARAGGNSNIEPPMGILNWQLEDLVVANT